MKTEKLKNGNVSARVYLGYKDGKAYYKRVTAETQKELKKRIAEAKADFLNGRSLSASSPSVTLRTAYEEYIRNHENIFSPSTIQGYKVCMRNSFQSLMDKPVAEITERDIQAEVNSMALSLSFKTISIRWSLFICVVSPYRQNLNKSLIKLPPKTKTEINVPERSDIEVLLSYAEEHSPEMVLPILLGAFCGLRRGEIGALTWEDIDLKKEMVSVSKSVVRSEGRDYIKKSPKSLAGFRSVPLPPRVLKVIRERQKEGLELISVDIEQITDKFPHLLKGAGLRPMRFHDLRHYFASQLVLLGIPDIYAIKLTGHSSTSMLRRVYQHTFSDAESMYRERLKSSL